MFWALNENREIVAQKNMEINCISVREGDIGAVIPEGVQMPSTEEKVWVGKNTRLANGVVLEANVFISEQCFIEENVHIGYGVVVQKYACIAYDCRIGSGCKIGMACDIGANCVLANHCVIGDCTDVDAGCKLGTAVQLGRDITVDGGTVLLSESKNYVQFTNFGYRSRTILIYRNPTENVVRMCVGCQSGITFEEFKGRVASRKCTTGHSAAIYESYMPCFEAIVKTLLDKKFD